jgi:hypothetical protein
MIARTAVLTAIQTITMTTGSPGTSRPDRRWRPCPETPVRDGSGITAVGDGHRHTASSAKALSSVTVPKGLTPSAGISVTCNLNLDCADVGSTIMYAPIKGNLQTCKAAMAIQATVPVAKVRWKGLEISYITPEATWAAGALPGVAAVPPKAADMTAACVKALSSKQPFLILSDLQPNAVPVTSAQALVTSQTPTTTILAS